MSRKGAFQFNRTPGKSAPVADLEAKLHALEERVEAKGNGVGGRIVDVSEGAQGRPKASKGARVRPEADGSDRVRTRSRDGVTLVRKTLRLPEDVVQQLEDYCERERWSAADVVAQALGSFLASK